MEFAGAARLDPITDKLSPLHFPILNPIGGLIDAKVTGQTLLMTTPAALGTLTFLISFIANDIDALTVAPTVSIGTGEGGGYSQLLAPTVLTGLDASNKYITKLIELSAVLPPSTPIYADVTVGATATKADISVGLIGVQFQFGS